MKTLLATHAEAASMRATERMSRRTLSVCVALGLACWGLIGFGCWSLARAAEPVTIKVALPPGGWVTMSPHFAGRECTMRPLTGECVVEWIVPADAEGRYYFMGWGGPDPTAPYPLCVDDSSVPVPEPGAVGLLAGLGVLVWMGRRRRE